MWLSSAQTALGLAVLVTDVAAAVGICNLDTAYLLMKQLPMG